MKEEFRSIDVGDLAVRKFGILMGVIALIAGLWITWKAGWTLTTTALVVSAVGAGIAVVGRVAPVLLRPVYRIWMMLAVVLGFIMTRVILSVVFYGIVTPIGLVMRLAGRDPLPKHPDRSMETYWIRVARGRETREETAARLRRYY
ncbi:MAG: hypothetical protein HKN17_01175 [Rhodothermales bacterium]|nr:hypothetical protein [Rhodothermales bacterium]